MKGEHDDVVIFGFMMTDECKKEEEKIHLSYFIPFIIIFFCSPGWWGQNELPVEISGPTVVVQLAKCRCQPMPGFVAKMAPIGWAKSDRFICPTNRTQQ